MRFVSMDDKEPVFYIGLHDSSRRGRITAPMVQKLHQNNVSSFHELLAQAQSLIREYEV